MTTFTARVLTKKWIVTTVMLLALLTAFGLIMDRAQVFAAQSAPMTSTSSNTSQTEDHPEFYVGLKHPTPKQIHAVLPGTTGKPVFLEFKSKFCLACKKMDPILERILPEYPQIETRIFDMMRDRESQKAVFELFSPNVVPTQVYLNPDGTIANVYYDFHTEAELRSALNQIAGQASFDGATSPTKGFSLSSVEADIAKTIQTGSILTIALAFVAGLASSFFPCTIGMLPVLVGYIGGYSGGRKRDIFLQTAVFILGLATVMTALGITLSLLGQSFGAQSNSTVYYVIGGLCLVMSLQMANIIHLPLPSIVTTLPETKEGKLISFYLLGCAFGLVASPCGTPVLATILGIISKQGNVFLGGISLFSYAIGQGVLLMIVGLSTGLLKHMATFRRVSAGLIHVSALLIFGVGVMFILQGAGLWNQLLLSIPGLS